MTSAVLFWLSRQCKEEKEISFYKSPVTYTVKSYRNNQQDATVC